MAESELKDPDIKEWHFHVYFDHNDVVEIQKARSLQALIIEQVRNKTLVVVCNGVTSDILPGIKNSEVRDFNTGPKGPHPIGSFETWAPKEYLAEAWSFFTLNRNGLTIFIHPITQHEVEDHSPRRACWLGKSYTVDLSVLRHQLPIPVQYIELGLGYSKKTEVL